MEQYLNATRNLPMLPGIEISPWPTSKSTNIGILSNLQAQIRLIYKNYSIENIKIDFSKVNISQLKCKTNVAYECIAIYTSKAKLTADYN